MKRNIHGIAVGCLVSLLVALSLAGCNGSSGDAGGTSAAAAALDSCKLLGAVGPEKILGGPTDSGTVIIEAHRDDESVSQCLFTATGSDRTVGLLIGRARGSKAPTSREAYIEDVRGANEMGAGEETAEAIQAGHEIPGLGDFALTYDLFTFNLTVWSGEYKLTVMLNGFDSAADAESRAVSVAKAVLAGL